MKLNCEVLSVSTNGDSLEIRVQGRQTRQAEWRDWLGFSLAVPDNEATRKAFYVGRLISVTVEPR